MEKRYDYLVIGSGPAGHVSAIRAAQLGLRTAIVEKDLGMFGGVCLNEGCIPAKSLYHSAEVYDTVKRGSKLCGLDVECGPLNMAKIVEKSREAAEQLSKGLSFILKKNDIDLIKGMARFLNGTTVLVSNGKEDFKIEADKFLVSTGSVPCSLPDLEVDGKRVMTSSHAIRLEKVPGKLLVVGGGAIGTEFASFFNIMGSEVTVIEALDSLLPSEDKEVSRRLQSIFKQRGIKVRVSSSAKDMPVDEYDAILVSVGRMPATSDLGLDKAGVKTDDEGFIQVDPRMRTSAGNIYAAGDVVRTPMLAHVGYAEGEVAAEAAAGSDPEPVDYECVPNAVYTEVGIASVGLTEEKAKEGNINYKTGKSFFKANGKAVVSSRTEGFIKVIVDTDSHKLLGAHIIGREAYELIHEFVVAKKAGLKVEDIGKAVHAHPTFSEAAVDACKAVFGKPIHG